MRQVVGVAVIQHGRLLAARRSYPTDLAGRWELPGGKVYDGEQVNDAARREVAEELGCTVQVERMLATRSRIDDGRELVVAVARLVDGEPVPEEHDVVRWLGPEDLDDVDWLPADRPFLAELKAVLSVGERLAGGQVGGAVRIGTTVRRPTGPWTVAVHALLDHLGAAGLPGVPRVLGVDEQAREVLTHLPGHALDALEVPSDTLLIDAMHWLAGFHAIVAGFHHPGPWRTSPGSTGQAGERIVCHHDFAPYNVAITSSASGERLYGVFDWDMAGPGTAIEDLGFAAWNWVPLYRELPAHDSARRLQLMANAYGTNVAVGDVLSAVVPRIERSVRVIRAGQLAGDPGMLNLRAAGEPERTENALHGLRVRMPRITAELGRRVGA